MRTEDSADKQQVSLPAASQSTPNVIETGFERDQFQGVFRSPKKDPATRAG
jgi:hypothetical protein